MKIHLFLFSLLIYSITLYGQPTNNPIKTKYGLETHWTEKLNWATITNVTSVSGLVVLTTNSDPRFPDATGSVYVVDSLKLHQTMQNISVSGGGVLFFPAGKYVLDFSVYIPSGVILRGETPPSDKQNAKVNNFSPPSIFIFPKYLYIESGNGTPNNTAFKIIKSVPDAKRTGLVYLTINRAVILFEPNYAKTIDETHEAPYKGTYAKEQPSSLITDIVIFGIRSANGVQPDPGVPQALQVQYHRFPYRMVCNISAFVWNNCFIANNRLNDTEGCASFGDGNPYNGDEAVVYTNTTYQITKDDFVMTDFKFDNGAIAGDVVFNYTDHYGISVNRLKSFQSGGYPGYPYAVLWHHTPEDEPGSFGTNIEVRDNWVYKTMRPAFQVGGLGIQVTGNVCRDYEPKSTINQPVSPTGRKKPTGATTFENRGIDISGWHCLVDSNYIEAYRSKVGGYLSTDGEGILHQESSGSSVNGMTITNTLTKKYIGLYKSKDMNNVYIAGNHFITGAGGWMLMLVADYGDPAKGASINNMLVENNYGIDVGISVRGAKGGKNVVVRNNHMNTYNLSCYVDTSGNISNNETFNFYTVVPDGSNTGSLTEELCSESLITDASIISPASDVEYKTAPSSIEIKVKATDPADSVKLFINSVLVAKDALDVNNEYTYLLNTPNKDSLYIVMAQIYTTDVIHPEFYTEKRTILVNSLLVTEQESVNYNKKSSFDIFPNPTTHYLIANLGENINKGKVSVIDVQGKVVNSINFSGQFVRVETTSLISGWYYLYIQTDENIQMGKAFFKK
jgi:hypothetical protein